MVKFTKAFTVIEILVVIVILGILTVMGTVVVDSSQIPARDDERRTDVQSIGTELEAFYWIPTYTNTSATTTLITGPTISSNYSSYDLLFCRFTSNCSGVTGISSNSSYQVAFTAKAGSRYSFNMTQIDSTSTSWTTGTNITTNITYATPTTGATISGNVITTANAGETRITFTGTGPANKTVFVQITEVNASNIAISTTSTTKALGVYTTVGSYTLSSPSGAIVGYLLVSGGGGGGGVQNEQAYAGYGGQGLTGSTTLVGGNYTISVGAGGNGAPGYNYTPSNGGSSSIAGGSVSATALGGKSGTSRCYSAYGGCAGTGGADPAAGYIGGSTTHAFTGTSVTYGVSAGGGALNAAAPSPTTTGGGGGAPWCSANCGGTNGLSGQVIIRTTFVPASTATSPSSVPSYPSTALFSGGETTISSIFGNVDIKTFRAPGVSDAANSFVMATNNVTTISGILPLPTISQYVYQPLQADGTLCTTAAQVCERFNIYYRLESDNTVYKLTGKNQ